MAGKALCLTDDYALRLALDKLTKNTAIDMLLDVCHREIGEDATPEQIAKWFSAAHSPVAHVRGDKPLNFDTLRVHYERGKEKHLAMVAKCQAANA